MKIAEHTNPIHADMLRAARSAGEDKAQAGPDEALRKRFEALEVVSELLDSHRSLERRIRMLEGRARHDGEPVSEPASLFAEVDHAADTPRADNPDLRAALKDELQLLFREIQKRRMPELSSVEWLDLFNVRLAQYLARYERRREAAIAGTIAVIDECARVNAARSK